MSRRRPSSSTASPPPAAPLDDDDLLEEILLRLPPQPSSLPRASLVCTRWRRVLSDPGFLRRFRRHHLRNEPPPLLGFFEQDILRNDTAAFSPTLGPPDRVPPACFPSPSFGPGDRWTFLGCRHGLALLICGKRREAVVWDPLSGRQRRVAFPPGFGHEHGNFVRSGAVMCAVADDGHVHGDCGSSPFKLALVGGDHSRTHGYACLYQSEPDAWGNLVSVQTTNHSYVCPNSPSVLVANAFCWLLSGVGVLEFDLETQRIAVIQKPADVLATAYYWSFFAVRTNQGGLGLAILSMSAELGKIIQLWERKSNYDGVAEWVLEKTIQLNELFAARPTVEENAVLMQGYDEDTNGIILSTFFGDYILQLDSTRFENLCQTERHHMSRRSFHPYRNFYTAGRGVPGGAGM